MINYRTQNDLIKVSDSIVCDICKTKVWSTEPEADEFLMINMSVGFYNDVFEDMSRIECDVCPKCLKDHLGPFLRIKQWKNH